MTIQELKRAALSLAGMNAISPGAFDDTMMSDFLTLASQMVANQIRLYNASYFHTESASNITVSAGDTTIDLPALLKQIIAFKRTDLDPPQDVRVLRDESHAALYRSETNVCWLRGAQLVFPQALIGSETFKLTYDRILPGITFLTQTTPLPTDKSFCLVQPEYLTDDAAKVTVTQTAHGLSTNEKVTTASLASAGISVTNATYVVTKVDADSFTIPFTTGGAVAKEAVTGGTYESFHQYDSSSETINPGSIPADFHYCIVFYATALALSSVSKPADGILALIGKGEQQMSWAIGERQVATAEAVIEQDDGWEDLE